MASAGRSICSSRSISPSTSARSSSTSGQVCQIAGISKMQLDYWTNKAQIPTKGKKQRIYDIDALETVMLIKQAKDKGLNLGAAIDAARRFREREARLALRLQPLGQRFEARRCVLGSSGVD